MTISNIAGYTRVKFWTDCGYTLTILRLYSNYTLSKVPKEDKPLPIVTALHHAQNVTRRESSND